MKTRKGERRILPVKKKDCIKLLLLIVFCLIPTVLLFGCAAPSDIPSDEITSASVSSYYDKTPEAPNETTTDELITTEAVTSAQTAPVPSIGFVGPWNTAVESISAQTEFFSSFESLSKCLSDTIENMRAYDFSIHNISLPAFETGGGKLEYITFTDGVLYTRTQSGASFLNKSFVFGSDDIFVVEASSSDPTSSAISSLLGDNMNISLETTGIDFSIFKKFTLAESDLTLSGDGCYTVKRTAVNKMLTAVFSFFPEDDASLQQIKQYILTSSPEIILKPTEEKDGVCRIEGTLTAAELKFDFIAGINTESGAVTFSLGGYGEELLSIEADFSGEVLTALELKFIYSDSQSGVSANVILNITPTRMTLKTNALAGENKVELDGEILIKGEDSFEFSLKAYVGKNSGGTGNPIVPLSATSDDVKIELSGSVLSLSALKGTFKLSLIAGSEQIDLEAQLDASAAEGKSGDVLAKISLDSSLSSFSGKLSADIIRTGRKGECRVSIKDGDGEIGYATLSYPSVVNRMLSDTETQYIKRAKTLLADYEKHNTVKQKLTQTVVRLISSGEALEDAYMMFRDEDADIAYFTSVTVDSQYYTVSTEIILDYEKHTFFYAEYILSSATQGSDLKKLEDAPIINEKNRLIPLIEEYEDNYGDKKSGLDKVIYYVYYPEYEVYVFCFANSISKWRYDYALPAGYHAHEIKDYGNRISIHNFSNAPVYNDCYRTVSCADCNGTYSTSEKVHQFKNETLLRSDSHKYGEAKLIRCELCKEYHMYVTTGGVKFDITLCMISPEDMTEMDENARNEGVILSCSAYHTYPIGAFKICGITHDKPIEKAIDLCIPSADSAGVYIVGIEKGFDKYVTLDEFILPEGVRFISDSAFRTGTLPRSSINSMTFPSTLEYIGIRAFDSVSYKGTELVLPIGLKYCGSLFDQAQNVTSITFNCKDLGWIGYLQQFTSLKNVVINGYIKAFDETFCGIATLESINVPEGVKELNGTFRDCEGLKNITLPSTLLKIGDRTFEGCRALETFTVPNSVRELGNEVFNYCSSLAEVRMSSMVTALPNYAFGGCTSLVRVIGCKNITSVGTGAFSNCVKLTDVDFSSKLSSVGNDAFRGCTSFDVSTILNSLTSISDYAFAGCILPEKIVFGEKVTHIGDNAFNDAKGCKTLIFNCSGLKTSSIGLGGKAYDLVVLPKDMQDSSVTRVPWGKVTYLQTVLPPSPYVETKAPAFVETIYFAGSEAEWTAMNVKISENTVVVYNTVYQNK